MNNILTFMKKEFTERMRTGRLLILTIVFILLGIMNPAVAKLTPWLLETMADSLAESGMTVSAITVDALTSWTQFFKNAPMGLIVFILMECTSFTREYDKGTLILPLTKGLRRSAVVTAKALVPVIMWTLLYWLSFGITYGYNAYYWDNSIAQQLLFPVVMWWICGILLISLFVMYSALFSSSSAVMTLTGGTVLVSYIASLFPAIAEYLPTALFGSHSMIFGNGSPADYTASLVITLLLTVAAFAFAIPAFNKKQL